VPLNLAALAIAAALLIRFIAGLSQWESTLKA